MELKQDWHIHTFRSKCGKSDNTVHAIVAALDHVGMRFAGISDHINARDERGWFEAVIESNRADLAALEPRCRMLVGTEATMLRPSLCALDADLAAELDFVIVACNHYHLDGVEKPAALTPQAYADHYLDMVLGAVELGFATTIAHPFLHSKLGLESGLETLQSYDEAKLSEVLRAAAKAEVAFEINPRQVQHAVEWRRELVSEGRRQGVKFTLGSDAHTLSDVGYRRVDGQTDPTIACKAIGLREDDLKWPLDAA